MKVTDNGQSDLVVLVDADGRAQGTAPRASVHGSETPRHLAFSCYLLADDGRVLVTRRALSKRTWPGVWTNSVCGHPRPGEDLADAVRRRAQDELGVSIDGLELVLPEFSYSARDDSGIVENELCPVFLGRLAASAAELTPDPDEVAAWRLVEPTALAELVCAAPWAISPWAVRQLADPRLLRAIGATA